MRVQTGRTSRAIAGAIALLMATVGLQIGFAAPSEAADAADFDPGYLVSDEDFFAGAAMTATEVDKFIAGMNAGCTSGRVCLENYREDVTAKAASTLGGTLRCAAIPAAARQTAGQIITTVGKACGISPKAILVILQKEQSLVTSRAPSSTAFQASMGAGCPDTAPCNGAYAGFYENVYYGAKLLKGYTMPSSTHFSRFAAGKVASIPQHPCTVYKSKCETGKPQCGYTKVAVKNLATHALYVYTPYTPNALALKYMYTAVPEALAGEECSSYGNRNFWRLWTDWFGPTGSAGALAVAALYAEQGGASGTLGALKGALVKQTVRGGGLYQQYAGGVIAWNQKLGAQVIGSQFAATWIAKGAVYYGWPTADTATTTKAGGGATQTFELALMTLKTGGAPIHVWSTIRDTYIKAGGPGSGWGWPVAPRVGRGDGLYSQEFDTGTVYSTADRTASVAKELVPAFEARSNVAGALGWPTASAVTTAAGGGGITQTFEKGALMASTAHGAVAVYGTTLKGFESVGGLAVVGWPMSSRKVIDGTTWRTQAFEKGSIVTHGSTWQFVGTDLVGDFAAAGFTTGSLGPAKYKPATTTAKGGGTYQGFTTATLAKQTGAKAYRVVGIMRTVWANNNRVAGPLGWPTASTTTNATLKLSVQKFQGGVVVASSKRQAVLGVNVASLAISRGVGTGALGWPTGELKTSTSRDGGEYQRFSGGTITWQAQRGAFYVPNGIWAAVSKSGGFKGPLGWPVAAPSTKSGVTTQKFEGGTVTWSTAKGASYKLTSA